MKKWPKGRVSVFWRDATSIDGWLPTEQLPKDLPVVETMGVILAANDRYVAVASSVAGSGERGTYGLDTPGGWTLIAPENVVKVVKRK